jgi:hypothetical protein
MHAQRFMVRETKVKEPHVSLTLRWDRGIELAVNVGVLGEFIH